MYLVLLSDGGRGTAPLTRGERAGSGLQDLRLGDSIVCPAGAGGDIHCLASHGNMMSCHCDNVALNADENASWTDLHGGKRRGLARVERRYCF